jgi:hypothetical protein
MLCDLKAQEIPNCTLGLGVRRGDYDLASGIRGLNPVLNLLS